MKTDLQKINELILQNCIDEAIKKLTMYISECGNDDEALYERGKLYWRIGDYSSAIADYNAAVAINPNSKAAKALEMSQDIMNFYNKDVYNP